MLANSLFNPVLNNDNYIIKKYLLPNVTDVLRIYALYVVV